MLAGLDFGVVVEFDLAEFLALEYVALDILIAMAGDASMLHIGVASPRDCRGVAPIGARRRPQALQRVCGTIDNVVVDRLRSNAGAESRREVALGQRCVVAIPMQMHAFARTLQKN